MTRYNEAKLKQLMSNSLQGMILTSKWLKNHGISEKLAWWYAHSGWLEHLGHKVYKKLGRNVHWTDAIVAIQQQLELPVYIGGKTALQLLGKAHYLPLGGIKLVELFTLPTISIPKWLTTLTIFETNFHVHKTTLFNPKILQFSGLTKQVINNVPLQISAPERAILEVFYQVSQRITYEESLQLMESLAYLRPSIVQELLEGCHSIKVKRLFLHAAEIFHHEWLHELEFKKIDMGKGKRKIGVGGHYDSKYQLSVPLIKEK